MGKGYIIEHYKVTDQENYVPPVKAINEILEKYNGTFLVATPKAQTLHGKPLEVIVVIAFNSNQNALDFHHSKEYLKYRDLYERTTQGWVLFAPEYRAAR
ncbi:MAG: DUF1330 domain-containing protein [Bacteroidota bacterium]